LVELVDPDRIDWRHGFFVRGLPADLPFDSIVPFEDWSAVVDRTDNFAGTGGIFHVSRCGSTLLGQNLKATGRAVVLSEPAFMRVLRTGFDGTLAPDEAAAVVAGAIGQWRDWAAAQGKALIVKFNSQTHEWQAELRAALPGARFVFLHREPAPVLESIRRGPPRYLTRDVAQRRHGGLPELDALEEDPLLVAATRRYCAALDGFAGLGGAVLPFAYRDLAAHYGEICRHFGFEGAEPGWDASRNAKTPRPGSEETYRPVGPDRIERFAARHAELLAVAEARYRLFLEGSGGASRTERGTAK